MNVGSKRVKLAAPSPRVRGEGEGASPLGAELRCSESRRGPLTLLRFAQSTFPRARGEVKNFGVARAHPEAQLPPALQHHARQPFGAARERFGQEPRLLRRS